MSEDTPAAKWRINGEPDPFGDRFNCQRNELPKGGLTDDEMANEVFMNPQIGNLQAAKDRIRWLSRRSEKLQATNNELETENKRYHALVDDLLASGCLGREEEKAALKMLTEKKYDDEIRIQREM